jgi:hypothetical protein
MLSFAASAADQNNVLPAKTLEAGSTWVVDRTTRLNGLTIPEGATVAAPPGHNLTLTVDGAGFPIKPGFYKGDVVLTVTDEILVKFGKLDPHHFRTAIYVDDGIVIPSKSVASAAVGCEAQL